MVDADANQEPAERKSRRGASVPMFVLLTFAASWATWIIASTVAPAYAQLAFLPGTIMPAIVALWLTKRESEQAFRELVGRLFKWQVSVWYYLFAVLFIVGVKLTAAALYRLDTGSWPAFGATPLIVMVMAIFVSTPVQAGEEIGWRGFMLERLADRFGFARASLMVGVIWAAWHLPMFLIPGGDMVGQSFPVFVLAVTALSVAMAWLYSRTGGSLLLAMIMHAAINNMTGIVPSRSPANPDNVFRFAASPIAWLTTFVLWAVAAILLVRLWQRRRQGAPVVS
jgi:membrane protease YdiL (CAAX protease family)